MVKVIKEITVKVIDTGVNVYLELPERIPQFRHEERLEYAEIQGGGAVIVKYPFKD